LSASIEECEKLIEDIKRLEEKQEIYGKFIELITFISDLINEVKNIAEIVVSHSEDIEVLKEEIEALKGEEKK